MNNSSVTLPPGNSLAVMIKPLFLLVFLLLCVTVARADASTELVQTVEKNSATMIAVLRENQPLYEQDPEAFYTALSDAVVAFVDVRRFAGRVMGKYGRAASEEQKQAFVDAFQDSLFQTYGKTLAETGEFSLRVLDAEINPRHDDRAIVNLEVRSASGQQYPLAYSMYRSPDKGWLVENVVVSGVNIGLAFRDRFEQEMSARGNDIDAVIANWSVTLDEVQGEATP